MYNACVYIFCILHCCLFYITPAFQFREEFFQVRTLDGHLEHLTGVESDDSGHFSKEVGVNCRSKLLELKHFDLCSGALVPDVMHDLLEGALQHVLQLLLCYCIEECLFTLSYLNEKMKGMELGYMEDNRPSPVDNCNHLKQNGTQVHVHLCVHVHIHVLCISMRYCMYTYRSRLVHLR